MSAKKIILWTLFVSSPTIIFACYLVYKLKEILIAEYGISISETAYWLILFFVMSAAALLSSKRILKEIFSGNENSE